MRRACLLRLLVSIYTYYPKQKIIVLDDSKKRLLYDFEVARLDLDITYVHTAFNIGVCKGRNMILDRISTKFFLLLDDDFILDRRSNIEGTRELFDSMDADIIGGNCFDLHKPTIEKRSYTGFFSIKDDILKCETVNTNQVMKFDFVLNFFVARTAVIQALRWNEKLPTIEHLEFFYRAKQIGLNVFYNPAMYVLHYSEMPRKYRKFRKGKLVEYSKILYEQIGVDAIEMDGNVIFG